MTIIFETVLSRAKQFSLFWKTTCRLTWWKIRHRRHGTDICERVKNFSDVCNAWNFVRFLCRVSQLQRNARAGNETDNGTPLILSSLYRIRGRGSEPEIFLRENRVPAYRETYGPSSVSPPSIPIVGNPSATGRERKSREAHKREVRDVLLTTGRNRYNTRCTSGERSSVARPIRGGNDVVVTRSRTFFFFYDYCSADVAVTSVKIAPAPPTRPNRSERISSYCSFPKFVSSPYTVGGRLCKFGRIANDENCEQITNDNLQFVRNDSAVVGAG